MTTPTRARHLLSEANPVPDPRAVHDDDRAAEVLFSAIAERTVAMSTPTRHTPDTSRSLPQTPEPGAFSHRRKRASLAFAISLVLALVLIGSVALLTDGPGRDVAESPEVTPPPGSSLPTETGEATASTAVAEPAPQETEGISGPVLLDPAATEPKWAQPALGFDLEGRAQVLYLRANDTAALAACDDAACSSASVTDVFTGGRLTNFVGTPRPGTGPAFWYQGTPTDRLVACSDPGCSDPTLIETDVPGSAAPTVAADGTGQTLVAYRSDNSVWVMRCPEPSCTVGVTTGRAWDAQPDGWVGTTPGLVLRNGVPIIAVRANDNEMVIGECATPACETGMTPLAYVPVGPMVRDPVMTLGPRGEPIATVFVNRTPPDASSLTMGIVVVACLDPDCNDTGVTEVARTGDAHTEASVAVGPDGRVHIAWTEGGTVFLTSCEDATCEIYATVDTGRVATDVSLAFDAADALVLATTSPDRGLELVPAP